MSRDMDALCMSVKAALLPGQRNARSAADLAEGLGSNVRSIRMAVDRLVKVYQEPIASTTEERAGYFYLATEAERQRYEAQLLSRMKELSHRMRVIHRCQLVPPASTGQMRLI